VTDRGRARRRGTAYLVGAGPGDPGLITVRGRELLDDCDAIVYDSLANPDLLERSSDAPAPELHDVGKRGGDASSTSQGEINALLVRLVRQGKRVVRLKGGDPFVFGRGGEEAEALAESGLDFEVIPGVTAGIAAPAYAGIPVTHRGLSTSVTLVTGHEDPGKTSPQTDWEALAKAGGTIVVYMGVKQLPRIAASLVAGGMPEEIPAAAIEWGTHPRQRTVVATLGTLAERMTGEGISPPVIVVIGWTVVLRDEIRWFDHAPLFGKRIVVTRAEEGLGRRGLGARLREAGAEVIETPVTRIERLDPARARATLQELEDFQWVCFTSANGVRFFWETLREVGRDARSLAGIRVCAVGPMTADALLQRGIVVDVVAERFVAEGLLEVLSRRDDVPGSRFLYAAAEGARDALPTGLEGMGADVERLPLYRSAPNAPGIDGLREKLRDRPADLVAFTSGSAARSYVEGVGPEVARATGAASIGPATTSVARELGIRIDVEAPESTLASLADAIVRLFATDAAEQDTTEADTDA
jgi:uroporphyrinogen III methyltransferase/synthase